MTSEGGEESMGDGEALLGPPTLGREGGLPRGRSTAESARRSLVWSVLMEGLTKLKFAILRSGATICDGGKSERSDGGGGYEGQS